MSWQDILNEGFRDDAEKRRRVQEQKGEEDREERRQGAEKLKIAEALVLRIKPVLQEFAKRREWGEIQEEKSQEGKVSLRCRRGGFIFWVSPSEITIVVQETDREGFSFSFRKFAQIPVDEQFTEESFAEALVNILLK